jgi:membrane-associated protease RseP (regulator of RpoE activity)
MFLATIVTTTTFGTGFYLSTRTDVVTDLDPNIGLIFFGRLSEFVALIGYIFRSVWSDPQLLQTGLAFGLPTMAILLSHELGHYVACRRNNLSSTYPFFLPAPLLIGTFGAFIRIRQPIRTRQELLDVGAAGPIAGFLVLLPFLIYGVANSEPATIIELGGDLPGSYLLKPGTSLLMAAATFVFHGPLPAGTVLNLHPFALAAWVGTFITAINLIPIAQLDGGHIFYAAFPRRQRLLAWWLLGLLALMASQWLGWLVWCVVLLIIGPRHPPVLDNRQGLDPRRQLVALIGLLILVLTFMPVPFEFLLILP